MSKQRFSAALATILEGFIETYLGEDKPILMKWGWRYLCAWFGIALFVLVALIVANRTISATGPTVAIISAMVQPANSVFFLLPLLFLLVSLLAFVVASGIVRGGPIRLFLVGVTLPALVFYFATAATAATAALPAEAESTVPDTRTLVR